MYVEYQRAEDVEEHAQVHVDGLSPRKEFGLRLAGTNVLPPMRCARARLAPYRVLAIDIDVENPPDLRTASRPHLTSSDLIPNVVPFRKSLSRSLFQVWAFP